MKNLIITGANGSLGNYLKDLSQSQYLLVTSDIILNKNYLKQLLKIILKVSLFIKSVLNQMEFMICGDMFILSEEMYMVEH